ncbi:hypothetical protein [Haloferax gibbonsii]|uniref:hypothetical protein n=1 Tax=Haloferax gibbonsii TaxID=35746 RepID=UPI0018755C05|nr:hypothetical protein [Haloferax gibbonsii]
MSVEYHLRRIRTHDQQTPPLQPLRPRFRLRGRLDEHVERRHPKEDVRWWVVVEDPAKDRKFSR